MRRAIQLGAAWTLLLAVSAWGGPLTMIRLPPLPPLGPRCKRLFSNDYVARVSRLSPPGDQGSCANGSREEEQRRITHSQLDCLMNGYEDATDIRMSCARVSARTPQGMSLELVFDSRWRCYRTVCQ